MTQGGGGAADWIIVIGGLGGGLGHSGPIREEVGERLGVARGFAVVQELPRGALGRG